MEDTLKLMKEFEQKNNTLISIEICSDGSGNIIEFWDGEIIKVFNNLKSLNLFLLNSKFKTNKI